MINCYFSLIHKHRQIKEIVSLSQGDGFASLPKACEFYYGIVAVIVDHHQTSLPLLINRKNNFSHANMALRMKLDFVTYLFQNNN